MSDRGAETGFAPIALTAAMAGRGGFQPRSFAAPAPGTVVEAEPALPEAEPAGTPFERGLAEGQRPAQAACVDQRPRLATSITATQELNATPRARLAGAIATTSDRLGLPTVAPAHSPD